METLTSGSPIFGMIVVDQSYSYVLKEENHTAICLTAGKPEMDKVNKERGIKICLYLSLRQSLYFFEVPNAWTNFGADLCWARVSL